VIVCTGEPTDLFRSLKRHVRFDERYVVVTDRLPATLRKRLSVGAPLVTDTDTPPHFVRWMEDGRVVMAGADQPRPPARLKDRTLVQRTGQLMYELSTIYPDISGLMPAYGWDAIYGRTADGLPYIGPHRNYPRHLFAFGDASHSVTGAYLASRVLLRYFLNQTESADQVFGFHRLPRSG